MNLNSTVMPTKTSSTFYNTKTQPTEPINQILIIITIVTLITKIVIMILITKMVRTTQIIRMDIYI